MNTILWLTLIVIGCAVIVVLFKALDETQFNRQMKPDQDMPDRWHFDKAKAEEQNTA